jgi:predicted RNase H-like nuclease (RuvC/YqgF family)
VLLLRSAAVVPQVSKLEADADQLQSNLMQSQQTVKTLERRLAGMEAELMDQQQRVRLFYRLRQNSNSASTLEQQNTVLQHVHCASDMLNTVLC